MKKSFVTLLTVAALSAAIAVPSVKADVTAETNKILGIVVSNESLEAKLDREFVAAQYQLGLATEGGTHNKTGVAVKGLKPAQKDLADAELTLKKAQEAKPKAIAATVTAEDAKIKNATAILTAEQTTLANVNAGIKTLTDQITSLEADNKRLNLSTGMTAAARTAAIAANDAQIAAIRANLEIAEANKAAAVNRVNVAQEGVTKAEANKAAAVAQTTAAEDAKIAAAQTAVTNATAVVAEWETIVNNFKARYDAAQVALLRNGLTDQRIADLIKQAQDLLAKDVKKEEPKKPVAEVKTVPIYRLYNEGLKVHLYTKDANEYKVLSGRGWTGEGTAFNTAINVEGKNVYRLYNEGLKVHLYTTDENEYNTLAGRGWKQEGVAFVSYGEVPVYRLYHAGIKKHLYTTDVNEYNTLAGRGWKQEGVAYYSVSK